MAISNQPSDSMTRPAARTTLPANQTADWQLTRWSGIAGLAGAALLLGAGVVVGILGLPDASDVETLTDYADIESGRIAEHFLYLGGLMLVALHVLGLNRLVRDDHPAAALFGTATAQFGLVILAASSLLHLATSPLSEIYNASDTPPEDLPSIEYAWHAGQSVFDTMLATGMLLVPVGIGLLGVAMRAGTVFGQRMGWLAVGLGIAGAIGAVIAIVDPGSMFSAVAALTVVVFTLAAGWKTLRLERDDVIDLAGGAREHTA